MTFTIEPEGFSDSNTLPINSNSTNSQQLSISGISCADKNGPVQPVTNLELYYKEEPYLFQIK